MYRRIEPGSLSGFTLFLGRRQGKEVWQLSYSMKGEPGWSVHMVEEATARRFLDMLSGERTDPPDITLLEPQVKAVYAGEPAPRSLLSLLADNSRAWDRLTKFLEAFIEGRENG